MATVHANGLMSPPQTEKALSVASPPKVVLAGKTGRILCVADIRGDYHELNRLIREHEATAVIHTGDFGFINADSLDRMGDKILRHLLQYSPLISPATRSQLLAIPASAGRAPLIEALNNSSVHFPLSQFPHLISGAITFPVPVFTVWGLIEDVRVLEKFRTGEYEVHNLNIIDEATTRLLEVSGIKLRLFGLGGAVAQHKFFDNGEGWATIAGGQGTMWTTALQIGELVDTAQRVYDDTETRLLVTSAPISRNGLLSLLSNTLKADLTISGGLHFRYPASFNEFAVHNDFDAYRHKLTQARDNFVGVYSTVKEKVDASMNEHQQALLKKAIGVTSKIPTAEDGTWTNTWHWVLSDASCGHMLISINDGRVTAETRSNGLNFAHRANNQAAPPSAPVLPSAPAPVAPRTTTSAEPPLSKPSAAAPVTRPPGTVSGAMPSKPLGHQANVGPPMGHIRGLASRPPPSSATPTRPPTGPTGAAGGANPVHSSIPAKPMQPPVRPRPTNGPAAAGSPATTTKAQPTDAKAPTPAPRAPSASGNKAASGISQPNGKPASPVPAKDMKGKGAALEKKKDESAAANGPAKTDRSDKKDADKKDAEKKDDKPKGGKPEKPTGDAAKKDDEIRDGKSSPRENAGTPPPSKKNSLYIKGIPDATTEDELKALFPGSTSKITAVKIIKDHFSGKQKNFAYVDFANEADCTEALNSHGDTIRETTVSISVSNPPSRFPAGLRGGSRGSFRGARGGFRGSSFGGSAGKREGESGSASPAPAAAAGAGGEGKKEGGGGGGDKKP